MTPDELDELKLEITEAKNTDTELKGTAISYSSDILFVGTHDVETLSVAAD